MLKKFRIARQVKEVEDEVTKYYLEHRKSVLHFDYENQTARLFLDGKDEGVIIFGEIFEVFKKLANGAKTCSIEKAFERMKSVIGSAQQ